MDNGTSDVKSPCKVTLPIYKYFQKKKKKKKKRIDPNTPGCRGLNLGVSCLISSSS